MTRALVILALLALALPAAAAPVGPDEYVAITLSRAKVPAQVEIALKEPSLLAPYALFPPAGLGTLTFTAKDSKDRPVDLYSPVPLKAGRYVVSVASENPSPASFNIMLRALSAAGDFSGNRTMDEAEDIDLPLSKVLSLRSFKDQAWYRFEASGPGVLLVRLANLGGWPGAEITVDPGVKDAKSKELGVDALIVTADASGAATHYFDVKDEGLWRVGAARTGPPASGDEAASRLDIVFYPDKPDEDLPAFVALGVSKDDPGIQQLSLRMRAAGRRVIVTNDPAEIEKSLFTSATKTMREARESGHGWLYWLGGVLLLLAAGGAGFYFWRRAAKKPAAGNN